MSPFWKFASNCLFFFRHGRVPWWRGLIRLLLVLALGAMVLAAIIVALMSITLPPCHAAPATMPDGPGDEEITLSPATEWHVCPAGPPDCSDLATALYFADDGDWVKVAAGTYVDTVGGNLVAYVSKSITLTGGYTTTDWTVSDPDANPTVLDGQGGDRVLYVEGPVTATISNFYLVSGRETSGGCVFLDRTQATLISNTISGCHGTFGAGVMVWEGNPTISGNTIVNNVADREGGGVNVFSSTATISGNTVDHNHANVNGGGLSIYGGAPMLTGNGIGANTAITAGGGLNLNSTAAVMSGNTISGNLTSGWGGGAMVTGGTPTFSRNTIAFNRADKDGGGANFNSSAADLTGNTFAHNTAGTSGGGLFLYESGLALWNNTITANRAEAGSGGGIYVFWAEDYPDIRVGNNSIWENHPDQVAPELGVVVYKSTATPAKAGELLKYYISIENTGQLPLVGIITDTLPPQLTAVSYGGGSLITSSNQVVWSNLKLYPNSGVGLIELVVYVQDSYHGVLTNTVEVTTDWGVSEIDTIYTSVQRYYYLPLLFRGG